jgi:hypothetical protein
MAHEEVVRAVPSALRQEVFREYGIVNPRPEDYEIDYLIAPGLGARKTFIIYGRSPLRFLRGMPTSKMPWKSACTN